MSIDTTPRAFAMVTGRTAAYTTPDGTVEPLSATPGDDIRQVILQRATAEARAAGIPVELHTTGDRGDHHLLIDADGSISPAAWQPVSGRSISPSPSQLGEEVITEAPGHEPLRNRRAPELPTRRSFIDSGPTPSEIARRRGALAFLGVGPPPAELARRENERLVSQQWAGCRTIAVANGKGGVGKTMTTAMLAAVFGRYDGGNVLAWDNNDTRGTLGWRTEQGLYDSTVKDLLPAASDLLAPTAGI